MRSGDTVHVRPGTYNERISPGASGAAGNPITYVGGPGVVCRGFDLENRHYLRIIGFEITHVNTSWSRGIQFDGTCSHIEILDNYFHHTYNEGGVIRAIYGAHSYVTVRGNIFYYLGHVPNVWSGGNSMAVQGEQENRHWLVEYNTIQRAGDFINMDGTFHIIRNNFIHDYSDSYWTAGAGHPDVFQPFNITNHVYEANVSGDSRSGHSHWLQIRDPGTNVIFRGNIGYNFGSYALQAGAVDHVVMYHNTFHDLGNISTGNPFGYNAENGNPSLDNHFFNNIVHTATGNVLLSPSGGSTVSASHNIGYRAPSHASVISTSDPLLVNPAGRRFELQGTSPAINAGRAITTITSPSGSGNSFNVSNPKFFCDGWGITGGDLINVGANPPVRITRVANNTITTDAPVTWTTGTEVYWRTQDGRPDIGGYEFRSGGYTFGVALISPSQGTVVSGPTTLTASVSNPECVRFVMFYANGVPVAQAMKAPYTASWVPREEGAVNLEARAYALYAGTNSVQTARITVNANADGIQRPAPPSNLRVVTQ